MRPGSWLFCRRYGVDMESIVKEDILANTVNDDEISKLNERIKELEKQIVEIVENK